MSSRLYFQNILFFIGDSGINLLNKLVGQLLEFLKCIFLNILTDTQSFILRQLFDFVHGIAANISNRNLFQRQKIKLRYE